MPPSIRVLSCCVLLVAATGCSRQVRAPIAVAALEIPPPPARLVIPVELTEPEPEPVNEPEPTPPPATPARSRDSGNGASRPPQPAAPAPAATPPAAETTASPVLQTTTNVSQVERQTMAMLSTAQRDLDRVESRGLSASARAQYEMARGFIRRAHENIKIRNYQIAEELARKAATLATALSKG